MFTLKDIFSEKDLCWQHLFDIWWWLVVDLKFLNFPIYCLCKNYRVNNTHFICLLGRLISFVFENTVLHNSSKSYIVFGKGEVLWELDTCFPFLSLFFFNRWGVSRVANSLRTSFSIFLFKGLNYKKTAS